MHRQLVDFFLFYRCKKLLSCSQRFVLQTSFFLYDFHRAPCGHDSRQETCKPTAYNRFERLRPMSVFDLFSPIGSRVLQLHFCDLRGSGHGLDFECRKYIVHGWRVYGHTMLSRHLHFAVSIVFVFCLYLCSVFSLFVNSW